MPYRSYIKERSKTSRKWAFRKKVSGLPGAFSNQFRPARLGYLKIKEAFRLPTCTAAKDFRLQRTVFRYGEKSVISRKYRNDKADAEIQQSPGRAFLERRDRKPRSRWLLRGCFAVRTNKILYRYRKPIKHVVVDFDEKKKKKKYLPFPSVEITILSYRLPVEMILFSAIFSRFYFSHFCRALPFLHFYLSCRCTSFRTRKISINQSDSTIIGDVIARA